MPFQLFGGKDEFLVRGRLVGLGIIGIIVGMDYELAVYGDRLIFRVVKVETAAETLSRFLALRVQHVRRPDGNDSRRLGYRFTFEPAQWIPGPG